MKCLLNIVLFYLAWVYSGNAAIENDSTPLLKKYVYADATPVENSSLKSCGVYEDRLELLTKSVYPILLEEAIGDLARFLV